MRTLSQHLAIEYTYEQAMEMGSNAFVEGLGEWMNPFKEQHLGLNLAEIRFSSLVQAWDTGYKIQQKAK